MAKWRIDVYMYVAYIYICGGWDGCSRVSGCPPRPSLWHYERVAAPCFIESQLPCQAKSQAQMLLYQSSPY